MRCYIGALDTCSDLPSDIVDSSSRPKAITSSYELIRVDSRSIIYNFRKRCVRVAWYTAARLILSFLVLRLYLGVPLVRKDKEHDCMTIHF